MRVRLGTTAYARLQFQQIWYLLHAEDCGSRGEMAEILDGLAGAVNRLQNLLMSYGGDSESPDELLMARSSCNEIKDDLNRAHRLARSELTPGWTADQMALVCKYARQAVAHGLDAIDLLDRVEDMAGGRRPREVAGDPTLEPV